MNSFISKTAFLLLFALLLTASADSTAPLVHFTFDDAVPKEAQVRGEVKIMDGISGKGVLLGDDGASARSYLEFPNNGLFKVGETTITFWMKPVDWDGTNKGFHFFFGASTSGNAGFRIYKYESSWFWFLVGNPADKKTNMQNVAERISGWKRGKWHHVAVSFRPGGKTFIGKESRQRLYLDGKLVEEKSVPEETQPSLFPATWYIGSGDRWGKTEAYHTVFDEFKVYDRELTPDEIKAEHLKFYTDEDKGPAKFQAGFMPAGSTGFNADFERVAFKSNIFYTSRRLLQTELNNPTAALAATPDELLVRITERISRDELKCDADTRDGEVYRDDSYEIFVGTAKDDYRQYIVNAKGAIFDGLVRNDGWNGNVKAESRFENGEWIITLRIPASDLYLDKFTPGMQLLFAVGRNCRTSGRTFFGNCLFGAHFHGSDDYNRVTFTQPGVPGTQLQLSDFSTTSFKLAANTPITWKYNTNGTAAATAAFNPIQEVTLKRSQSPTSYAGRIISQDGTLDMDLSFVLSPALLLSQELNPDNGTVSVKFNLSNPGDLALFKDKTVVFSADGKEFARRPYAANQLFRKGEIPARSFALDAKIIDGAGTVLGGGYLDYYHIDYDAWRNYDGGADDNVVPTPWTPVDFRNSTLFCLDREYRLEGGFLPRQTMEKNQPILEAPITLNAVINGKRCDLNNVKLRETSRKKGEILLAGSAEIGGCRVDVKAEFEFDGYYVVDCTIDRRGNKITSLSLDIPLNRDNSLLKYMPFLNEKPVMQDDVGAILPLQQWDFGPGLWVGGDHRGITWFTESDQFHFRKPGSKMYILKKQGDLACLTVNFIDDANAALPGRLNYVFGMQVTPIKPFPEPVDWMNYSFVWAPNHSIYISGWSNNLGKNYQGMPGNDGCQFAEDYNRSNKETIDALVDGKITKSIQYGKPLMPIRYLYPNMCAITVPEFQSFKKYWEVLPSDVWGTDGPDTVPSVRISPLSESWCNFYCWRFDRYFSQSRENGMYQDFGHPILDNNPLHGAGYEKNGKRYPTYCIFAYREIQKRLYRIAKKYETPERRIFFIGHSGGSFILPHGNFWAMTNDGEYYGGVTNPGKPYTNFFNRDRVRAEFNGRQLGIIFNFIPIAGSDRAYTEDMFSFVVPAGVTWMHHSMINRTAQNRSWNSFQEFGGFTGIEKFHPFWDCDRLFANDNSEVMVSAFERNGKLLIAAGNPSAKEQRVTLTFKRPVKESKPEGGSWVPAAEGGKKVTFTVKPRNFLYIQANLNNN